MNSNSFENTGASYNSYNAEDEANNAYADWVTDQMNSGNFNNPNVPAGPNETSQNSGENREQKDRKKFSKRGAKALAVVGLIALGVSGKILYDQIFNRSTDTENGSGRPSTENSDRAAGFGSSTAEETLGVELAAAVDAAGRESEADKESEEEEAEETEVEAEAEKHGEFALAYSIDTEQGAVEIYHYSGGYIESDDPYAVKYEYEDEDNFENEDAYGLEIEGETNTERTSNWLKRVAQSPEATVRLRSQMDLDTYDDLEAENDRADELRKISAENPDAYDEIVNETIDEFAKKLKGGSIRESHDWMLENYGRDQLHPERKDEEGYNEHLDHEVHGRLNSDDDKGDERDLLLTFVDRNGNNFVSSLQGYNNTKRDAEAENKYIGQTAWVNMDEGGTWKWKAGVYYRANTSNTGTSNTGTDNGGGQSTGQSQGNGETQSDGEGDVDQSGGGLNNNNKNGNNNNGNGNNGNSNGNGQPGGGKNDGNKRESETGVPPTIIPDTPVTPPNPNTPPNTNFKPSKNAGNETRISDNAEDLAEAIYGSSDIVLEPTGSADNQAKTGKPTGSDYEGTSATFEQNTESKDAETVGTGASSMGGGNYGGTDVGSNSGSEQPDNYISEDNNYSYDFGGTSDQTGPVEPSYEAPAVEQAPTSSSEFNDVLGGLGIG